MSPARAGSALIGLCLLLAARASAYPAPGPDEPRINLSAHQPIQGVWRPGNKVAFDGPTARSNYLLPLAGQPLAPDVVRVRIDADNDIDVALLFRVHDVQMGFSPVFNGYGLALDQHKGQVAFLRFDQGAARNPDVAVSAPDLAAARHLEVVLSAQGPVFAAHVYDAETKAPLAALSWSDAAYAAGGLGMYAHRSSAPFLLEARAVTAPPAGDIAPEWWVRTPRNADARYDFARRVEGAHATDDIWVTDAAGVQRLREAGATLLETHAGIPHAYRYPSLYERKRAPIEPTRRGISFVDGLKDPDLVERHLRAMAARWPEQTKLETIGTTHQGRPIWALTVADDVTDDERPTMLLCAAHHALEAITPDFVLDAGLQLLEHQTRRPYKDILKEFRIVLVPLVNVDGSHTFWHVDERYGRKNQRPGEHPVEAGVDLNRNYPFQWNNVEDGLNSARPSSAFYRGPSAGSEPEVQAMMRLAERERPVALVSFHSAATKILVPYTVEGAINEEPSVLWEVAEDMTAALPHRFYGRRYEAARNLYPVGGVDQDWYLHRFGTLAYLVEVPWSRPSVRRIKESVRHTRGAWLSLLERWRKGPSLAVQVVDPAGNPVEAEVVLTNLQLENDERWTTQPGTGRFYRYVSKDMPVVELVVRTEQHTERRRVEMKRRGVTDVNIVWTGTDAADEAPHVAAE